MIDSVGGGEEGWTPPENFAMVHKGVYRSGFPTKKNLPFLKKLGVRTIVYLCLEDYPEANLEYLNAMGCQVMQFGVSGNKEPFVDIPDSVIRKALRVVLDPSRHPLLIHCNKGKHRTGCLVGCLRKTHSWSMTAIFEEYRMFSYPKSRFMDQQFIELFDFSLSQEEEEEEEEALKPQSVENADEREQE